MISCQPFYNTLLEKGIPTKTQNPLCEILECQVSDILEYRIEDN